MTRILTARKESRLSIEQASERLGWPSWRIERYESGASTPPSVCLRRMADVYGISVASLRGDPE